MSCVQTDGAQQSDLMSISSHSDAYSSLQATGLEPHFSTQILKGRRYFTIKCLFNSSKMNLWTGLHSMFLLQGILNYLKQGCHFFFQLRCPLPCSGSGLSGHTVKARTFWWCVCMYGHTSVQLFLWWMGTAYNYFLKIFGMTEFASELHRSPRPWLGIETLTLT